MARGRKFGLISVEISVDENQKDRFTEQEFAELVINHNMEFDKTSNGTPLLCRKTDGKVVGQITEINFKK
jgi:hypothetical protein